MDNQLLSTSWLQGQTTYVTNKEATITCIYAHTLAVAVLLLKNGPRGAGRIIYHLLKEWK